MTIRASESINLSGLNGNGGSSSLESFVNSGAIGNGGNLTIETGQLNLSDGADVLTATLGQGNAGDLTIRASESVNLSGNGLSSSLRSNVGAEATGNSGNITIETTQLSLSDGASISALTSGQGNAGSLTIRASESVTLSGFNADGGSSLLDSFVSSGAVGNAGNLTIETAQLNLFDAALISASTFGQGNAGNIIVDAVKLSLFDGANISSSSLGQGNAGNLTIRATESVTLSGLNGDGLSSLLTSGTGSEAIGDGGDIFVDTSRLSLLDGGQISTVTLGQGNAGKITVDAAQLNLSDGAFISASSFGQGNAGDLTIRATESIALRGLRENGLSSSLDANIGLGAIGDSGNISIETPQLSLFDGGQISTSSFGQGDVGNIIIDAAQLSLSDGADISTSTGGQGNAGDLTIRATESIILGGFDENGSFTSLQTLVGPEATGDAGNITIETGQLKLFDGAFIATFTSGQGNAGSITIDAAQLNLFDGTNIATSTFGQGNAGNLTIRATESVTLSGFDNDGFSGDLQTLLTVRSNQMLPS